MDKPTSNYIDQLLLDSGLFPNRQKPIKLITDFDFSGETILITGAAGSIGSELTRQLVNTSFKRLILIDIAESALYDLIKELEIENTSNVDFLIFNITDQEALPYFFEAYKPTLIFHTAAYKHVPLMEENPYQALKTNVLASMLLADLSVKHQVNKFVFVSTDKAVNPISVMGMTKKIAENYLKHVSFSSKTVFISTRFGNVLGSNGSVLPLFIKQIENEKTITLTNKDATRYFINKHKACHLILKIGALHNENSILTFNMGKPIKLMDLTERLIKILGKSVNKIQIKITGLRPGEKLHEDLLHDDERLKSTSLEEVFNVDKIITPTKKLDNKKLYHITPYLSNDEIKSILKSYI